MPIPGFPREERQKSQLAHRSASVPQERSVSLWPTLGNCFWFRSFQLGFRKPSRNLVGFKAKHLSPFVCPFKTEGGCLRKKDAPRELPVYQRKTEVNTERMNTVVSAQCGLQKRSGNKGLCPTMANNQSGFLPHLLIAWTAPYF